MSYPINLESRSVEIELIAHSEHIVETRNTRFNRSTFQVTIQTTSGIRRGEFKTIQEAEKYVRDIQLAEQKRQQENDLKTAQFEQQQQTMMDANVIYLQNIADPVVDVDGKAMRQSEAIAQGYRQLKDSSWIKAPEFAVESVDASQELAAFKTETITLAGIEFEIPCSCVYEVSQYQWHKNGSSVRATYKENGRTKKIKLEDLLVELTTI
jgi:hypothetical protein